MSRETLCWIALTLLLLGVLASSFVIQPVRTESMPHVSIVPSKPVVEVGEVFDINVTIGDLDVECEMVAWSFWICTWVFGDQLDILDENEGPFMKQFPSPPLTAEDCTLFFWEPGTMIPFITFGCLLLPSPDTNEWAVFPEGDGTLLTITVRAIEGGNIPLELVELRLQDANGEEIPHSYSDSSVQVMGPELTALIDINPGALSLRSKGKWITAYIELPDGYSVDDVDVSTILLNDTVPAEMYPTSIGDYDGDSTPDLMVKFDRQSVIELILADYQSTEKLGEVTLTITGELFNGTPFEGSDSITTIRWLPGKVNMHMTP